MRMCEQTHDSGTAKVTGHAQKGVDMLAQTTQPVPHLNNEAGVFSTDISSAKTHTQEYMTPTPNFVSPIDSNCMARMIPIENFIVSLTPRGRGLATPLQTMQKHVRTCDTQCHLHPSTDQSHLVTHNGYRHASTIHAATKPRPFHGAWLCGVRGITYNRANDVTSAQSRGNKHKQSINPVGGVP